MGILAAVLCIAMFVSLYMVQRKEPPLMARDAWNDLMAVFGFCFLIVLTFGDVVGN